MVGSLVIVCQSINGTAEVGLILRGVVLQKKRMISGQAETVDMAWVDSLCACPAENQDL